MTETAAPTNAPCPDADPEELLAGDVGVACRAAVDSLHLAAALETAGVTDEIARTRYGHVNVFSLADDVYRRLRAERARYPEPEPVGDDEGSSSTGRAERTREGLRDISRGLLYALPGVFLPAAALVLDHRLMVLGMVAVTAFGWVWSMGTTVLAYRLVGRQLPATSARLRFRLAVIGVAIATGGTTVLALLGGGRAAVVLGVAGLAAGQMAYQMAAGLLVFARREIWLVLPMAPAVVVAIGHMLFGLPTNTALVVCGLGLVGIGGALAAALWTTARTEGEDKPMAADVRRVVIRRQLVEALPIVAYAAVSATYLLFAEARHVTGRMELALGAFPLVLGMGALEWRARLYRERAAALLRGSRFPADFGRRVTHAFTMAITTGLAVLGALCGALLGVLAVLGALTYWGVLMVAGHLVLGGVYFTGFVLIERSRIGFLLAATTSALAVQVIGVLLAQRMVGPHVPGDVVVFVASSVLLLVLLLTAVRSAVKQVWRYGW